MGLLDALKSLFTPAKPPAMENLRVQYDWGTLRLAEGWRFDHADHRSLRAVGPGGCLLEITLRYVAGAISTDAHKQAAVDIMKTLVRNPAAQVTNIGSGLWVEAPPAAGVLRIAVVRFAAQRPGAGRPPMLEVTLSAGAAETFGQLRTALRGMAWT